MRVCMCAPVCVRVCVAAARPGEVPFVFATNKTINKTQTAAQAQNVFMSNCHAAGRESTWAEAARGVRKGGGGGSELPLSMAQLKCASRGWLGWLLRTEAIGGAEAEAAVGVAPRDRKEAQLAN